MRRFQFFTSISHTPGHLNVQADGLSRFKQPLPVDLDPVGFCDIHWKALLKPPGVFVAENGRTWPKHFDIQHCEKELRQSADCGVKSISFWGVITPAGRFSIKVWCLGNSPPREFDFLQTLLSWDCVVD